MDRAATENKIDGSKHESCLGLLTSEGCRNISTVTSKE